MISKKPLKFAAILFIIILSLSLSVYGCKNMFSRTLPEEDLTGVENSSENSLSDIDSEIKLKAFETAHVYVEQKNPGASFESGYAEDKVIAESEDLFKVIIDFSSEGKQYSWEILLKYNKQDDSFTVIEAPDTEGEVAQESSPEKQPEEQSEEHPQEQSQESEGKEEPSSQEIKKRAFHSAQADAETMYSDVIFDTEYDENKIKEISDNKFEAVIEFEGLGQGATGKDHFTWKYQLEYDKETDKINILNKDFVSSYPIKKSLTEQEIKKGAFHSAQADLLKSYPNVVFAKDYNDNLVEALGNNLYQCVIMISQPKGKSFLYLVRYDPDEDKMHIPFKKDLEDELFARAIGSVKNYIEKQDNWVQNNCSSIIFDNNNITLVYNYNYIDDFAVDIKFQCLGKDGSSKWYDWVVKTRYDIISDSFVEFDMSGNIL